DSAESSGPARPAGVPDRRYLARRDARVADHAPHERGSLVEHRPDEMLEPTAGDAGVDVHVGVVVGEDRGGHGREVDLCRICRLKDLVPELELDRAPQSRELATRRTRTHEVVERIEERLL